MDTNEIKARLAIVQEEINEVVEQRRELAMNFVNDLGVEDNLGINLDELSKWAREVKKFNTKLKELANERKELREAKRGTVTCECGCHQ
jgi:proteasome assembly chaperone (PAC2) family protein